MPILPILRPLLALPLLAAAAVVAQPRYALTDLPAPVDAFNAGAIDVNNRGQVLLGGFNNVNNELSAWLYTPGNAPLNLSSLVNHVPAPGQRLRMDAMDLNDRGQVAGVWSTVGRTGERVPWQAFVYDPASGLQVINTAVGGEGLPEAINERGQVAGFADVDRQRRTYVHDLATGTTRHTDVGIGLGDGGFNDAGLLAGSTFDFEAETTRMALFDSRTGTVTDLGDATLGSRARDMNEAGWVVGEQSSGPRGLRQPFLYRPDLGVVDLGALPDLPDGAEGFAQSVNERGQIVGNYMFPDAEGYAGPAFLHDPSFGMLAVEALVVQSTSAWSHLGVSAINDLGWMVGNARSDDGTWRSVLLTPLVAGPVPEPAPLALMAMGLAALAWRRRAA
jgi:hypothetical protein